MGLDALPIRSGLCHIDREALLECCCGIEEGLGDYARMTAAKQASKISIG